MLKKPRIQPAYNHMPRRDLTLTSEPRLPIDEDVSFGLHGGRQPCVGISTPFAGITERDVHIK